MKVELPEELVGVLVAVADTIEANHRGVMTIIGTSCQRSDVRRVTVIAENADVIDELYPAMQSLIEFTRARYKELGRSRPYCRVYLSPRRSV